MCQTWRRPGLDPGLDPAQTGVARFRPYRCSSRHTGTLAVPGVADAPPAARLQQAVADGKIFLAPWCDQAHAIRWTAEDLFGLLAVPEHAKPSFNRLSRYDETGLIWLLEGRTVLALTATSAAIQSASGNVTIYRKPTAWGS